MKPLRIVDSVADYDLPRIILYHLPKSRAKAERIVGEYERAIAAIEINPNLLSERPHGWRVYVFRTGTYLLYYRELEACWLVGGVFHALRDPDWIQAQLLIRETAYPSD